MDSHALETAEREPVARENLAELRPDLFGPGQHKGAIPSLRSLPKLRVVQPETETSGRRPRGSTRQTPVRDSAGPV